MCYVFIFWSCLVLCSPLVYVNFLTLHSLLEVKFPDFMKVASVVPIFKAGHALDVNNYRPISILPTLSKIFEKLMKIRVTTFLDHHNVLSDHQFGFRSGSSTSDAILEFLNFSYDSLNSNEYLLTIFLDFSKTFDTLDHNILLSKMSHLGITWPLHARVVCFIFEWSETVCYTRLSLVSSDQY